MKFLLLAAAGLVLLALLLTIVPGFQFSIALCICFAILLIKAGLLLKGNDTLKGTYDNENK